MSRENNVYIYMKIEKTHYTFSQLCIAISKFASGGFRCRDRNCEDA